MVRLFLAVPIPQDIKNQLAKEIEKIQKQLSDWQVNWVKPENLHVTLIFLGWLEKDKIAEIKKETAQAVKGIGDFKITTGPLNTRNRPIWFELTAGEEEIVNLYQEIMAGLAFKGPEETRPYHAHLTIGRVKKRGKSKSAAVTKTFTWEADRVVLYESKLRRTGPIYKEVASFPLKG